MQTLPDDHAATIAASALDLVFQTDPQGRIVWVSHSVREALGIAPEELLGTFSVDLIHPDDRAAALARRAQLYGDATPPSSATEPHLTRYRTQSKEYRWFRIRVRPMIDTAGETFGLIISAHDVHEEHMVAKALEVLSAGNRHLVQATTEEGLLQRMCEIIVEAGGYAFCWYGKPVPGEENSLQVIARAGNDHGAIARVTSDQGLMPVGGGPTGKALRTGTVQTSGDFMTEPGVDKWAESFGAMAIGSAVCLPVVVAGEMDGVLTVYGTELGEFDARAQNLIGDLAADLGYGLSRLHAQAKLETAWSSSVDLLAATVEARDPYTSGHQSNVADLAVRLGEELGVAVGDLAGLRLAAYIHDIGKIAIPLDFLAKPGPLTATEIDIMRRHASVGWEITKNYPWPWPIAEIIHQHHERLDGTGYPRGLRGNEILLEAQLVAVADVYDAVRHRRTYHEAFGQEAAIQIIADGRGTQFNPDIVDALQRVLGTGFDVPPTPLHELPTRLAEVMIPRP